MPSMKVHFCLGVASAIFSFQEFVSAQTPSLNHLASRSVNPNGIPTLIYNCAKLPAICSNVQRRNPLEDRGPGMWGKLVGNDHIVLNYDTNGNNREMRNSQICPSSWKNTHVCPETSPAQPNTVPQGASYSGGYAAARYNPNGLKLGDAGYNVIADKSGGNSGMIWTCDEWPPAISIEGGSAGGATSYCAPASGACGKQVSGVKYKLTEQNFQSFAHSALRQHVSGGTSPTSGVWEFHFRTLWDDDKDVPATMVEYYEDLQSNKIQTFARRRSSGPSHFMVDEFFNNGTVVTRGYALTKHERHNVFKRTNDARRALSAGSVNASCSPAGQLFETLSKAPVLPLIEITRYFILEQAAGYLNSSQTYLNQTLEALGAAVNASTILMERARSLYDRGQNPRSRLTRRQNGPASCGPGNPCSDGSCCNSEGHCGYGSDNCGTGCTSNCDATAACGRDSAGGNVSCPLNVCCSYYGFCGVESDFCSSPNPQQPCQTGFGSCQEISAPTCGGDSSSGRSLAYYQVGNVRERQCNRITPAQIDTKGLTHLILAFASIDPSTFEVIPADNRDLDIYPDFTGLQNSGLETWVAIGGWNFNDPGNTQTTFSDIASTAANRATFISSLQSFLTKYKFQGVDIDWEYPGAPDRAGKPADTENFVSLLKEMRAAFGSSLGISATLPASYWYLRWFDPIAMQPYVDFFNLMTYDLHGPWDAGVKAIGQTVLGQTNIPEIYNWTLPLWYDGLDPSKINMGLAYYGRGYTLADPSCNTIGCNWTGPSKPGPCTNFGGVMSLQELTDSVIPSLGVQPTLLAEDMMKQLTWSDQWIGYDDLETISMKKTWASQHCFGGTMIWSIDLFSGTGSGTVPDGQGSGGGDPGSGGGQGGGGDTNGASPSVVYIDPSIWSEGNPTINCQPPCTFVLPPLSLAEPTTISFPLYTTSLEVAWSESGTLTSTIQQTVLTIPPVTTQQIEVWAYTVTNTNNASSVSSSFDVTSSVRPPPFIITDDPNPQSSPGVSHLPVTRTITPPPYPYTFTSPDSQATSTSSVGVVAAIFPVVTYKPGPPGPLCKSGCGSECLIFCEHPCLLDCPDGGQDFADPEDPHPSPDPGPPPGNDPLPSGQQEAGPTGDPNENDPQDPDEEEEDDECALELGLPEPTYDGTIGQPSATVSIAPPPPPASPSPPPPPSKPSPNPATESVYCFKGGAVVGRGDMIKAIDNFCDAFEGTVLDATDSGSSQTLSNWIGGDCVGNACADEINVSVTVINGCEFTLDGSSASDECGRILRRAVDQCDTGSTKYKKGGTINSNCAQWLIDPYIWWD